MYTNSKYFVITYSIPFQRYFGPNTTRNDAEIASDPHFASGPNTGPNTAEIF